MVLASPSSSVTVGVHPRRVLASVIQGAAGRISALAERAGGQEDADAKDSDDKKK